ncbi:hypothetical protein CEXT_802741 [Caerostris extrusa]|uniref:Uncharacterized protein n=1 Tax=Caerostris extrusa TaxID=172846 RepID=A0AAV4NTM4_CAEEX|nr:hypothetical protein CEXT_802741 [Caerostris extrusa]
MRFILSCLMRPTPDSSLSGAAISHNRHPFLNFDISIIHPHPFQPFNSPCTLTPSFRYVYIYRNSTDNNYAKYGKSQLRSMLLSKLYAFI